MKKLLTIFTSLTLLTTITTPLVGCLNNQTNNQQYQEPAWVKTFAKVVSQNKEAVRVAYENYYVDTNTKSIWDQHDYLDIAKNNNLFIYLQAANNLTEATQYLQLIDTSDMGMTTKGKEPIIFDSNFESNQFITQDTSVGGAALMAYQKFDDILNSSKAKTTWGDKNRESFIKFGSMSKYQGDDRATWWNSNHWEKLLSTEKNIPDLKNNPNVYSELDLYNQWAAGNPGMNVPLSVVAKGLFKLHATTQKHVYRLEVNSNEYWINNNGEVVTYSLPHWGFMFRIYDTPNQQAWTKDHLAFSSPQLPIINKEMFKYQDIKDYLLQSDYLSFNDQETTKFKDNKIMAS
ncbi:lipoprotein [Spiroplasma eriocheiris]|uniref:Lipoprotein n=1 Tax=Spiroplasma eriocheiris TaxID=315358 RepID=A0A0H3XM76_9MOLU|nr:lipoprotein [Spiroplasma eriocheiris]AHF57531.1 hypothetical protein SPE_0402 [Spiroplasma eriocheiris CCTCC M 207170]AKM53987.1 hypothetical protein SERIO_v1c04080 [Spiroplasma eriocheiris]